MSKEQIVDKVTKKMDELDQIEIMEDLIKQGIYEFTSKETKYRVRKPSHQERMDIQKRRRATYTRMVKDDSYLFADEWKKIYKEQGIDLDVMDSETVSLQKQEDALLLRLSKTNKKKDIELLEDEITAIREKKSEILSKKSELLQYSVEDSLNEEMNSYSLYILLEILEGDKWIKAFQSYEDFLSSRDEDLIIKGAYYLTLLLWNPNV